MSDKSGRSVGADECGLPGCTTTVPTGWDYCNAHRDKHGGRR